METVVIDRPPNAAAAKISTVNADFWRCVTCRRLVTGPEMDKALGVDGSGQPCPCGSSRFSPTNCPWYGWLMPRVLKFAYRRLMGEA